MTIADTRREKQLLSQIKRNDDWPKVKRLHLRMNPKCVVCNAKKRLVAHHIRPYYLYPELELDPENLVTLCESDHLIFGHLRNYVSYNLNVAADAAIWSERITHRPKWKERIE